MEYKKYWRKGLVFLVIGLMILGSGLLAVASEPAPEEPTISPERVVVLGSNVPQYFPGGNTQQDPLASELPAPEDTTLLSYKIDEDQNNTPTGYYENDDGFRVFIWNDGSTFRYRVVSNHRVYHAYAKGGNQGGNLYMYYAGPDGEVLNPNGVDQDAAGLSQPGGGWSHITFFYDEVQLGQMEIEKVFDTDDVIGEVELPDEIVVHVSGPSFEEEEDGYIEVILNEENDWKVLLEDLIIGDYTVEEQNIGDEWDVSISPEQPVTVGPFVEEGDLVEVTITNTYIPGQLEIEKVFDTEDVIGEVDLPDEIVVHVSGPSFEDEEDGSIEVILNEGNGWKVLLKNLIIGDYTVEEQNVGEEWDVSISPEQPVTVGPFVEEGDLVEVTITNTYIPGELIINKQWIFDELYFDDEIPESITVLIEGPSFGEDGLEVILNEENDWTYKNDMLLPGKYTISELDVDTDTWTVIYVVDDVSSAEPVEVDVNNGETTEVTIQNIFLFQDETIWAYSKAAYDDGARGETVSGIVYRNNEIEGNNSEAWGWTNFINSEGTHEFLLFAAAGQNDTERGTLVGRLIVEVYEEDGSTLAKVEYMVDAPFTISEYHLWVGETPLPMVRRGRNNVPTAAPGQFPYTNGAIVEVDLDAGFYVAAHGVVRIPSFEME